MKGKTAAPAHPVENILQRDLQLFDLKQMIDYEARYKQHARESIRALKSWQRHYAGQTDMVELLYGSIEGVMLRRRAEDFTRLYWLVRADSRKAIALYMGRLPRTMPCIVKKAA